MSETKADERVFLAAAKRGERIRPEMSIHPVEKPDSDKCPHTTMRTIICADDMDVAECAKCGRQMIHACNFDEDFA